MTIGTVYGKVCDAKPIRRFREPMWITMTFDPFCSVGNSSSEVGVSVSWASFAAASRASDSFISVAMTLLV
jgi:hypothetical protein